MSDQQDDAVAKTSADEATDPTPSTTTSEPAPGTPAEAKAAGQAEPPAQLRLRRAPRYRPFGITGAVIGVIIGVALALSFTAASNYSMQTIVGYFAAILGLIGAVAGLSIAVLIERRRS